MKATKSTVSHSKSERFIYDNTRVVEAVLTLGALAVLVAAFVIELTS